MKRFARLKLVLICLLASLPMLGAAAEPVILRVDFARSNGVFRAFQGVNKGPMAAGGTIDLTASWRELGVPSTRLHDCQWPYPDVVDMHAIFRNEEADPERVQSYDFALTDEYLAAVHATGARMIYRLGESIEHARTKRFVHPPRDLDKWAAACLGIIRHYNEGWANGFQYQIQYWEIWNEPENRPAMWSGTDEDYYRLYRAAARAIKGRYPALKVGGPAVGYSGRFVEGRFEASEFVTNFLARCRRESLPLDFFSWHCYTADPQELVARARAIRRLLNAHGFANTESHLNEWNYLPNNSWDMLSKTSSAGARQQAYEAMSGAAGAAFLMAALIELQDAPLDVSNFYHGDIGVFGLFNEYGVPAKNFYGMRAFQELLRHPARVETRGGVPGKLAAAAGISADRARAALLVSNFNFERRELLVQAAGWPWNAAANYEVFITDSQRNWQKIHTGKLAAGENEIKLELPAPGVALIQFQRE